MIHYAEILRTDKTVSHTIPTAQYWLNEQQIAIVVGGHTNTMDLPTSDDPVAWTNWGPLEEISFMMQSMLINSMMLDGWNFDLYPNPQVFMGELKGGAEA